DRGQVARGLAPPWDGCAVFGYHRRVPTTSHRLALPGNNTMTDSLVRESIILSGLTQVLLLQGLVSAQDQLAQWPGDIRRGAAAYPIVRDVNGDGFLDVLVSGWGDCPVSVPGPGVYLNSGNGSLVTTCARMTGYKWPVYVSSLRRFAVGDVDGDHNDD